MLTLSDAAVLEKNKVSSTGAWLILLEFDFDGDTVRLCSNTEDVTWDSETWTAFPFKLDAVQENNEGEIPNVVIYVGNQSRAIQGYVEDANGGVDTTVTLRVVHSEHLEEVDPEIEEEFTVLSCKCTEEWAAFTLGGGYPTRRRFPARRYMTNFCPFEFKGVECGYSGGDSTCDHTLTDCRTKGNSDRFGGFPSIPMGGFYV